MKRDKFSLIGKAVVGVREMTKDEAQAQGWDDGLVVVVVFEDGTRIWASRDEEGNDPGELFGCTNKGVGFYVRPEGA